MKQNSKNLICKICRTKNRYQYRINSIPSGAQIFNKNKKKAIKNKIDFVVFECTTCSLVQAKVKKVPYYKETIRSSSFSNEMLRFRKNQFKEIMKIINSKNISVLELGSGSGEYLDIFKSLGCSTFGIEGSVKGYEKSLKNLHNVKNIYLDAEHKIPFEKKFDIVASFNFIEHLVDPIKTLTLTKQMLKDTALCIFEVPNFDKIKSDFLYNEFIPDHLFYFTKSTFRMLLEMSGYEILEIGTTWDDYIITIKATPKKKIEWNKFENKKQLLKKQIYSFFNEHDKNFNAVWSAGHQSLTTISTLELQNMIGKIIDSATFKQNKFSPGSGIEIVSPDELKSFNFKKILVMGAGFNSEICTQIKKKYKFKGDLAILDNGNIIVK